MFAWAVAVDANPAKGKLAEEAEINTTASSSIKKKRIFCVC